MLRDPSWVYANSKMIKENLKFLVIEGYRKVSRDEIEAGGMTLASELYKRMILSLAPNATVDVITPADADTNIPAGVELKSYDGATMTGSNLSVMDSDNPSVRSQLNLQDELFEFGVPSFGSCWALQVGTVVAGGKVGVNPKGREMGFGRKIRLTADGTNHPMYRGKGMVFDAFASHDDEITVPPPTSKVLAGNSVSEVQSLAIKYKNGEMWSVQYHPEYNTKEMASLIRIREERLIRKGFFFDSAEIQEYTRKLDLLYEDPKRKHAAWSLGIDDDILDENVRRLEFRNWIENLVLPRATNK